MSEKYHKKLLSSYVDVHSHIKKHLQLPTFTKPSDAVENVATLTFAAVGAQQVDTAMACTNVFRAATLIDIYRGIKS